MNTALRPRIGHLSTIHKCRRMRKGLCRHQSTCQKVMVPAALVLAMVGPELALASVLVPVMVGLELAPVTGSVFRTGRCPRNGHLSTIHKCRRIRKGLCRHQNTCRKAMVPAAAS